MASADFLLGPDSRITSALSEAAERHTGGQLRVVSAWANDSGARLLIDSLAGRINELHCTIGVNSKLTTIEGVIRLRRVSRSLHLYYRHPRQIFHPKFYWFSGGDAGSEQDTLIVGSSNLTAGGFVRNIEASLILRTDHDESGQIQPALDAVARAWNEVTSPPFAHAISEDSDLESFYRQGRIVTERQLRIVSRAAARLAEEPDEEGDGDTASQLPIGELPVIQIPTMDPIEIPFDVEQIDDDVPQHESTTTPVVVGAGTSFVMTLQRTDAGVGQVTAGTARRSPEVFIPLIARDINPSFWDWPDGFEEDPNRPGKRDRHVRIVIGDQAHDATIWYNPVKRDIRIRAEAMRSAGRVGDILLLEQLTEGSDAEYRASVAEQGSETFAQLEAMCTVPVRPPSRKRFGYF